MQLSNRVDISRRPLGRTAIRAAVATVSVGALIALAGCGGSSKPAYCTDRTNLENSIKGLTSLNASSVSTGVSALKSQVKTIKSDATAVVNTAKSDFPSQTSAVKTSVDALQSAVNALHRALRQHRPPESRLLRPAS